MEAFKRSFERISFKEYFRESRKAVFALLHTFSPAALQVNLLATFQASLLTLGKPSSFNPVEELMLFHDRRILFADLVERIANALISRF